MEATVIRKLRMGRPDPDRKPDTTVAIGRGFAPPLPDNLPAPAADLPVRLRKVEWVQTVMPPGVMAMLNGAFGGQDMLGHWSRKFEYPWALVECDLTPGMVCLDAAGGDGPLQYVLAQNQVGVVNVDLDLSLSGKRRHPNVIPIRGDLRDLPFPEDVFDAALCVSVLEHVEGAEKALAELVRVLKPGGRLVLTLDVASHYRWNHTLDAAGAAALVGRLGASLPPYPERLVTGVFPEYELQDGEPGHVALNVLCVSAVKEG